MLYGMEPAQLIRRLVLVVAASRYVIGAVCKMFAPVLIFQIGQQAHLYVNDTERVGVLGAQ